MTKTVSSTKSLLQLEFLSSTPSRNKHVRRAVHAKSRHPTLDTIGTRSRAIRRCTSKKRGSTIFDLSLQLALTSF